MPNQSRAARKKINLVRKAAGKKSGSLVWFIGKRKNSKIFYVADYDDVNNTITWTKNKKSAISFKSERTLNVFILKHLHNRTDIMLVQTRAK